MALDKLTILLDNKGVRYELLSHAEAYTAQETAERAHVRGRELAKVVMVRMDGELSMAVLPATHRADLRLLADAAGATEVVLAGEDEFRERFPDCEIGAMPPFGNLYGLPVYVAEALAEDEQIVFSAGTHHEVMKMSFSDFERLVRPRILRFAVPA